MTKLTVLMLSDCADSVREPAIEEGLICRAAFGEAKVTLALKRLERTQENGLPAALPARGHVGIQRVQVIGPTRPSGVRSA